MPNYNPAAPIALTGPPPLSKEAVRAALAGGAANGLRSGTGAPSAGLGNDGDFYIDTSAWTIYGPKTAGSWGSSTSIVGPTGNTGAAGNTGTAGATGPAGPHDGTQNEYGYNLNSGCGGVAWRIGALGVLTVSGTCYFSYFRAPKSFTANTIKFGVTVLGSVAATLSQFGIYSVDASTGALTGLLGSTPNDTTLFTSGGGSSSVPKTKGLSSGVPLVADTWYAVMVLTVQTGTAPTLVFVPATAAAASNLTMASLPRLNGTLGAQASLPTSVSAGSITAANVSLWTELL